MASQKGKQEVKNQLNRTGKTSFEIKDSLKTMRDRGIAALTNMIQKEQVQIVNWAQYVFNRYRTVIKRHLGKIKNSSDLPFPKEEIRLAIKVPLPAYLDKASVDVLDDLKEKNVGLGTFQKMNQPEDVLMELIISEQKILLEEINAFINDLPALDNET
jgi:hypothetical protein